MNLCTADTEKPGLDFVFLTLSLVIHGVMDHRLVDCVLLFPTNLIIKITQSCKYVFSFTGKLPTLAGRRAQ